MPTLELYTFSFTAMGTLCAIHLYSPNPESAQIAAHRAFAEIQRIESRYSRYQPDSDLSQINCIAQSGGSISIDEETAGLFNFALEAHRRSSGLFDITSGILLRAWDFKSGQLPDQRHLDRLLPCVGLEKIKWEPPFLTFDTPGMELDFGALGKQYAADRAALACLDAGLEHGLVDLAGDIRVIGPHPDGHPWDIGIRHPRLPGDLLTSAQLSAGALATAGDYQRFIEIDGRRYAHILNPQTGWPVMGLSSITVIAEDCLLAGTLSTIAMLKGMQGPPWLKSLKMAHVWMDLHGDFGQSFLAARPLKNSLAA